MLKRRQDWFESQPDLDPDRLVFIDETWASTNMARRCGRCLRGERLRMAVPHRHWKTTTFVGALTLRGFIAPWVLDGPINRHIHLVHGSISTTGAGSFSLNLNPSRKPGPHSRSAPNLS